MSTAEKVLISFSVLFFLISILFIVLSIMRIQSYCKGDLLITKIDDSQLINLLEE